MIHQVFNQARKHPSLIPLFMFTGAGAIGAGLYVLHLAFFNPDVCRDRKNNPEPWNKLDPNDRYKFHSVNMDYSKLKKDGPNFQVTYFITKLLIMKVFQKPHTQFST